MENSNQVTMGNQNTKITDLNCDCLENIFKYLEFDDLLNIADSSQQFYNAVCLVYKKEYANKEVVFDRKLFRYPTG